jgi:hypothetical protein
LFVTTSPPHLPAQAAPLSMQQLPSGMQTAPLPSVHWPLLPQATVCPQLLTAVPQVFAPHDAATGSGAQPHALAVQGAPLAQLPQLIGRPQLSFVSPQRLLHQFPSETHSQAPLVQAFPVPQVEAQDRGALQLSVAAPHLSAQVTAFGSGVQELVTGPPVPAPPPTPGFPGSIAPSGRVRGPVVPASSSAGRALSKSTPAIVPHPPVGRSARRAMTRSAAPSTTAGRDPDREAV